MTATREPLNYIPFMLYALVWMHCVATLARSGVNRVAGAAMMLAAWFAAEMWGIERWPFVATDYVDACGRAVGVRACRGVRVRRGTR